MKKKILIFTLVVFGLAVVIKTWVETEVRKVQWAISLAGGMSTVASPTLSNTSDYEKVFIESFRIRKTPEVMEKMKALRACSLDSTECEARTLAVFNFLLLHESYKASTAELISDFNHAKHRNVNDCEVMYETTRTLLASQHALSLPKDESRKYAESILEKIKKNGGIDHSVNSKPCKKFFEKKPIMAKAYLAQIAFLMSIEKGQMSPGWLYLMATPGVNTLIN